MEPNGLSKLADLTLNAVISARYALRRELYDKCDHRLESLERDLKELIKDARGKEKTGSPADL